MAVTIKEIAKEAGVSIAAVSKALNNRGGIGIELKYNIEQIARRLGYAPYMKSRESGMFAGPSKYIGMVFAWADEHLTREIQRGIDTAFKDSGFYQIRYNINIPGHTPDEIRKEDFIQKILEDKSIAGLMSVFLQISDATIAKLRRSGIPVVILNNHSSYGKSVSIDNVAAAHTAVKSLLKQGRRKIGLIMPEEANEHVWIDRLKGYKKALAEARIPYDPYLIVYDHSFSLKQCAIATKTLIQRDPGLDAIVFGSDQQAYGGLEALRILGKKVPEDIAVIGFDDLPFSRITNPPLSTLHQPMFEMGKMGGKMLLEAVKYKNFSHKAVVLKSQLVARHSSDASIPVEKLI